MTIENEIDYENAIRELNGFLAKGFSNLSSTETDALQDLSRSIANYENVAYPIARPETLAEMVELRMYQRKLNQKQLADLMEISPSKLSLILTGKREPDLAFLKNCKKKLSIPADFILDCA
jgi:HTH-type transcriptional regulator/antitoxin HigA